MRRTWPTAKRLIVRSAVKVKAETLAKAPKLRVIGRAGVGVDNVDLNAATAAGVLVMNTPGGNAVSVAEHTFALMLGLARMVPAATASTTAGKWEKKKFLGNELRGKVLGVIGLGNIGQEVVRRARGFEMRVLASDPYVSAQTAANVGVELVPLDQLLAQSDYISLHVAKTPETVKMLNAAAFAKMKDGARIINCARGELIDQAALGEVLASGKLAGRRPGRLRNRASARGRRCADGPESDRHAAYRRRHRGGAGDRRHPHRRTDGGVSQQRHRDQRREHARHHARAVPAPSGLTSRWPSGWGDSPRTSRRAIRSPCASATPAGSPA